MHAEFSWVNVKEWDGSEGMGVRWEDNIKPMLEKQDEALDWFDLAHNRGQVEGFCEHGNKISDSIKFQEFLDPLKNCSILNKGSASFLLFILLFMFYKHNSQYFNQDASSIRFSNLYLNNRIKVCPSNTRHI